MLVWGGVQWLLSGAIPAQASEARDKVRNAILGLLLILASFLIVQVINPELTIMRGVSIEGECRHEDPDDPTSPCVELTAVLPGLSSEEPLPGQFQCEGAAPGGSFENNTATTLQDAANGICAAYGIVPLSGIIHTYLRQIVGEDECTVDDVDAVHTLLETTTPCGTLPPPGGEEGGVTIDATTVRASLCTTTINPIWGIIGDGAAYSAGAYGGENYNVFEGQDWTQSYNAVRDNVSVLVNYCSSESGSFCVLNDESFTSISTFNDAQQDLLTEYCVEIVLGSGP